MKIAMIGQKGVPAHSGGVEQHVEILSRLLAERGHQVDVYCRRSYLVDDEDQATAADWSLPGVRRIFRACVGTKHLDAITHTATSTADALLRDADVIHYHALGPASLSFLPRLAGRRVVVTVHGLDWQRAKWGAFAKLYLKLGERVAADASSRLVVVSKPLRDYFRDHYRRDALFIPNGVRDIGPATGAHLATWDLKPGRFLLNVARLVPEKGQHYLIEAFERLVATGLDPDWRLVLAGGSALDSNYEEKLRALAGPRVVFTGAVGADVLADLYHHAYLFALPSEIEGMALTLLEALSCARAALVSDIPENAAVIEDGGFLFRCADVGHLAETLAELLASPEKVAAAGRAAARVAEAYRWPKVADALEDVYCGLLATRAQGNGRPPRGQSAGRAAAV